ncbi:MAG: F0F1 ATP synthase subunit B [Proteobacteria bacterium]|nr:F0F1 ATP synthase subunit B [Pseudomonadota bacterium]
MNFNATVIGQIIAFAVFWWFCTKFIWPVIIKILDDRKKTIADGLAAAEKGVHELKLAEKRAKEIRHEGKEQSQGFITQAQKRADEIVDEAKDTARLEGERILVAARTEIERERQQVKEDLRQEVATLAIAGAEQILRREVDRAAHKEVLDQISASL